jgi:hypothetical protein
VPTAVQKCNKKSQNEKKSDTSWRWRKPTTSQALENGLAQLERLCAMKMEAMDTLQAKLQKCNHADMGGGGAAAKSAALLTRLEGLHQKLKSKTEALENLEVVRLRLEGQLANAKVACKKHRGRIQRYNNV